MCACVCVLGRGVWDGMGGNYRNKKALPMWQREKISVLEHERQGTDGPIYIKTTGLTLSLVSNGKPFEVLRTVVKPWDGGISFPLERAAGKIVAFSCPKLL